MHATVIGIDCATDPRKVGLARTNCIDNQTQLSVAEQIRTFDDLVAQIVTWLQESQCTLLALDAPLGWPANLGTSLFSHEAGHALSGEPSSLFTRSTDRFIHRTIGKKPLDVGADRIARTAFAALRLLHQVRQETGKTIPLAWQPGPLHQDAAIEVYPGGTLKARRLPYTGYKRRNEAERAVRQQIINYLETRFQFDNQSNERMLDSADSLDAALCCLAGIDFLDGNVLTPDQSADLTTEGWIWVSPPLT